MLGPSGFGLMGLSGFHHRPRPWRAAGARVSAMPKSDKITQSDASGDDARIAVSSSSSAGRRWSLESLALLPGSVRPSSLHVDFGSVERPAR